MIPLSLEEEVDYIKNEIFALQLDIAIRVEGKDDETVGDQSDKGFWATVFDTVQSGLKYKIYKESNYTTGTGKKAVLEFKDHAAADFILVVDSDYDYIIGDDVVDNNPYILQTYAYSFENYICNPLRLASICCRGAAVGEVAFDFNDFYCHFSQIVEPLFFISINEELRNSDTSAFTRKNLGQVIRFEQVDKPDENTISNYLNDLKSKVNSVVEDFPITNEERINIQKLLSKLDLETKDIHWLLRGKDIYDLTERLMRHQIRFNVEEKVSEIKENTLQADIGTAMNNYMEHREPWKDILATGFDFIHTPFFPRIQNDINSIFEDKLT